MLYPPTRSHYASPLVAQLKLGILFFLLVLGLAVNPLASAEESETTLQTFPLYRVSTPDKPFDDVVDDLLSAIAGANFRLTEHAKIGQAIAEREGIAFPQVVVLHFCNLTYAQKLLTLAPAYASHMPCRISVRSANNSVIVEVLLLPTNGSNAEFNAFATEINDILRGIVAEGVG